MNIVSDTPCEATPWNEGDRLAALASYGILDTEAEDSFDGLAELAADIFDAPIAVVNLIADGRQWFKAEIGIGQRELPLDVSICRHAILQPGVFVVPDLTKDERFTANPLVTASGGLRFYAGALLETAEGLPLGTVCVLDREPRPEGISRRQERALKTLASQVMELLERRRGEAELRASEARFSGIFSNAAVGLSEISLDGRFLQVNDELCAILGRTRENLLSASVAEVTFEQDIPESLNRLALVIDKGEATSFDKRYTRPDGRMVWANSSLRRLDDGQGRPRAILAVTVDLTARRQTAEALRVQEERLRLATKAAGMFVWETDQATGVTSWSDGAAEVIGVSEQELSRETGGGTFFVSGADRDRLTTEFEEAVASRVPLIRPEFVSKDGRAWRAEISITYDAYGKPARVFGITQDITDAQRRQEQVRASEARLRGVLDGMAEGFVLMDSDFRILTINAEGLRQDGRSREEIIGRTHWEVFPGSEELEIGRLYKKAFAQEVLVSLEHSYVWPDGRVTWLDMRAYPTPDGLLAVFWRDATDRKSAESKLQEKAAEFEALAENVSQLAWMANAEGHIYWYNKRWYDYTGTDFQSMEGWGWREVHHPDHVDQILEEVSSRWAAGQPWEGTYQLRGSDGVFRPFLTRVEPIHDASGKLVRWFGTNTDITDRVATEIRLVELAADVQQLNETLESRVADALAERKVFADIVEGAPATIMALDREFNILAGNAAAVAAIEKIYGKHAKVGDNLLELLTDMPEHREQVRTTWSRALAGEHFVVVDEFGDARHERIAYEARFSPLHDRDGKLIGAAHTAYDVTDRVRAEAELYTAQEALRQSQKMEAMGQLTGGVAHDFNNLLTPIVGALDMLQRRGVGNEREQRLIGGAAQSAERARTLVQRLLAFARRQPLQPVPVDIAQLVHSMADLISSTTGPQVKVTVDAPDDLPTAKADPNQLEMALLNLAVNARDAMPSGGILRIGATVERISSGHSLELPAGPYVRLSVADTGTGMDAATAARAIEPFFSTKGVGRGTGLGLSMVHGLASQLGGALTIRSQPGLGTDVMLWLPISDAPLKARDLATEQQSFHGLGTVLLVDDETLVRASTAEMLKDFGYSVVEAASAEEALSLHASGFKPKLLVTDHLMPGMNGTDLIARMRQAQPSLIALLISGYAEVDGIDPNVPRLTKPFRHADLGTILATLTRQVEGSGATSVEAG